MNTLAPLGHRTSSRHLASGHGHGKRHSARAEWAWGLIVLTFPVSVVAAAVTQLVVEDLGLTMGMPHTATEVMSLNLLNYGFLLAVMTPLCASLVVGLSAWRRERDPFARRAAHLSAVLLVFGTVVAVLSW